MATATTLISILESEEDPEMWEEDARKEDYCVRIAHSIVGWSGDMLPQKIWASESASEAIKYNVLSLAIKYMREVLFGKDRKSVV